MFISQLTTHILIPLIYYNHHCYHYYCYYY